MLFAITSILGGHAQGHADYLASTGSWHHSDLSPLVEVCDWAGENIYRGGDPDNRWDAYADSPTHLAVMNHSHTHHVAGKAQMDDGRWVVVDVFCEAAKAEPKEPTNTTTPATKTGTATSQPRQATEPHEHMPLASPPRICLDTAVTTICVL